MSEIARRRHGFKTRHVRDLNFCWLGAYVHEKVIESYRPNPQHIALAHGMFRPIADDVLELILPGFATCGQRMQYGTPVPELKA